MEIDGIFINIERECFEPINQYLERLLFVGRNICNVEGYKDLITYSKIYNNIKYKNCTYNKNIVDTVDNLAKKLNI